MAHLQAQQYAQKQPQTCQQIRQKTAKFICMDHAGELGAFNIYRGQLLIARFFYADAIAPLIKISNQEQAHYKTFDAWLKRHDISCCYALFIWAYGGFLLGIISALFGKKAMWASNYTIESTVLQHFEQQLKYLQQHNMATFKIVQRIKNDEQQHQQYGALHGADSMIYFPLNKLVKSATKFAIWLSSQLIAPHSIR